MSKLKGLPFNNEGEFYEYYNSYEAIEESCLYANFVKSNKKEAGEDAIYYLNIPVAFDIETTSIKTETGEKHAFMYHWQMCVNDVAVRGRTWPEFIEFLEWLKEHFGIDFNHRIVIYVHNLSYEFQFFRKLCSFWSVFSLDNRKPVKALTVDGIEFRCSYILSGMSLKKVGDELPDELKREKLDGRKYDYSKIRTWETPLEEYELKYCEMDVRVVAAYIRNKIAEDGNITGIQLTKTSYVRMDMKRATINQPDKTERMKYRRMIKKLTLEHDEYIIANRAFTGGFTHAAPMYIGIEVEEVDSFDFTSSYPTVLVQFSNLYPMSKGKHLYIGKDKKMKKKFERYTGKGYVSIFNIKFEGLRSKDGVPDFILSLSKCYADESFKTKYPEHAARVYNGRVESAYLPIYTTMTNVDFEQMKLFYDWDSFEVLDFWYYMGGHLPKEFVQTVLKYYAMKTMYKGKDPYLYKYYKEMLNSLYGMLVTNILRDLYEYTDEWQDVHKLDESEQKTEIDKYNDSNSRFSSYLWGIFCTAYARKNLYSGILEFGYDPNGTGGDYLYTDTDSLKVKNIMAHMDYINNYNINIIKDLERTCNWYNIDPDMIRPADKDGTRHPLGVWDHETADAKYTRFKTLGAKRYLVEQIDKVKDEDGYINYITRHKMTVAGLPKTALQRIEFGRQQDAFDLFELTDGEECNLSVTPEEAEKKLIGYYDIPCEGIVQDHTGQWSTYREESYVYMEDEGFDFGFAPAFIDYIIGIRTHRAMH